MVNDNFFFLARAISSSASDSSRAMGFSSRTCLPASRLSFAIGWCVGSGVVEIITARGVPAFVYPDADTLLPPLLEAVEPGDVVIIMSNGSFGSARQTLTAVLQRTRRK